LYVDRLRQVRWIQNSTGTEYEIERSEQDQETSGKTRHVTPALQTGVRADVSKLEQVHRTKLELAQEIARYAR
jgi:hypothetical protein